MTVLKLNKMVFYGKHGCYSEEKETPQRFQIDITIYLESQKSQESDELDDTVDWASLQKEVKNIVESKSFNLAEKLANEIVLIVKDKNHVDTVKVTVSKLDGWGGGENGFPSASVKV